MNKPTVEQGGVRVANHGKELKCIDCGSRLFTEYNKHVLACEECGQLFDTEKDFEIEQKETKPNSGQV